MSTTIDSIQIEIQSNSFSAAKGIDDLAESLKKLKTNGTIGVATKNLKNLSDALAGFKDASNVTRSLGKLSGAMERLKNIGSVANIANGIKKLSDNLRTIDNIDIDSVAPQIERVANALAPLSAVKAGGISTMMNGLKKLGEVTKELDDDKIAAFSAKVNKLNEVLAPLSEKMTSIQSGFRAIGTSADKASRNVDKLGDEVNVTTLNMANMITVVQGVIQALQPVIQKLQEAIGMAIEWDGIAARFGRGFGAQAEETYAWIQRLNEEMGINVQQFMQYSSVYATMLTGFGVAMEDAGKMALGYTELTYDIWAGYNDVYKNFADAAEAVKSAIAGEVEPIRRAGFTIVESTLAQTAANHGLNISLEKATEAQKSYLRYLTLVDQAHSQGLVGTYAKELQTAEGLVRTLTQQTKSLAQAFGSLFLPILVRIIPWVQAFVDLLTDAVHMVAGFFGIEIQKVDWSGYGEGSGAIDSVADSATGATGALNDATKAAKELKNATLGIDELNVISPPSSSSGSGGSGSGGAGGSGFDGLDVDSLWDESIFDHVQSQVDELKKKIKDMLPTIAGIGTALAGLRLASLLDDLDLTDTKFSKFESKIKGLSKGLSVASIAIAVGAIVWDLTGAYLDNGSLANWLAALGTTAIGAGLAYKFGGKGGAGFTLIASGIVMLSRLVFDISQGEVDFGDSQTWITMITGGIETAVGGLITWKVFGPKIIAAVKGLFSSQALASIGTSIGGALSSGWTALVAALSSIPVWGWIAAAVVALIGGGIAIAVSDYDFSDIGYKLGHALGNALKKVGEWFSAVGDWFVDVGKAIWDGIKAAFQWVADTFDIHTLWDVLLVLFVPGGWVAKLIPGLVKIGKEILPGIWEGIKAGWNNFVANIQEFIDGFLQGWRDGLGIASPAKEMIPIGRFVVEGIWSGITGAFNWIVTKVTGWATDLIGKITGAMKPSAISDKLSTMWTNAKNWWNNSKGTLKTYTPNIGSIYEKVKERWDNARTWWNEKKSAMKQYTPSIGSIYEKVYDRWKNARDWWNGKKAAMKTYTPSIGSITDKIKSAWNSAKSWWNKNAKLSTKLNISVPKIKVKWDTATAFGKSFKYPTGFKLEFAANGGIFDQGSLVWAGERGAEIVANAGGGKTGVMNVQQMQDAVYEGVYAAVVSAMSAVGGNNGSQPVNVYLDGKQITATVERRQRERGAAIMGNQVYSY